MCKRAPMVSLSVAFLALGCSADNVDHAPSSERADGARRLTAPSAGESNQNPCFSPDGSYLVFTRFDNGYNSGPAHLYRLDLGSDAEPVALTAGDYDDVNVPWGCFDRATGGVVFASDREGANDIWRVAPVPGAGAPERITQHAEPFVWLEPVTSPDGTRIALEEQPTGAANEEQERGRVVVVDLSTGAATRLTNLAGTDDDRLPSWSADGAWILYQHRDPAVPGSIDAWAAWIMAAGGGTPFDVSARAERNGPVADTDLSWMPDGRFVLSSAGVAPHPRIHLLSVEGGPPIRVTADESHEDGAPCASPDGKRIAFESHRTEDESSPSDLWIIDTPPDAL